MSLIRDFKIEPNDVILGNCLIYNDRDHFTKCGELELLKRSQLVIENWLRDPLERYNFRPGVNFS